MTSRKAAGRNSRVMLEVLLVVNTTGTLFHKYLAKKGSSNGKSF